MRVSSQFQFLLGRLETPALLFIAAKRVKFQFLLGRLETKRNSFVIDSSDEVSIPLR